MPTAIDLIITATFTGFGVALGNLMFVKIQDMWKKHKENAKNIGEKLGSGFNKTFINKNLSGIERE